MKHPQPTLDLFKEFYYNVKPNTPVSVSIAFGAVFHIYGSRTTDIRRPLGVRYHRIGFPERRAVPAVLRCRNLHRSETGCIRIVRDRTWNFMKNWQNCEKAKD